MRTTEIIALAQKIIDADTEAEKQRLAQKCPQHLQQMLRDNVCMILRSPLFEAAKQAAHKVVQKNKDLAIAKKQAERQAQWLAIKNPQHTKQPNRTLKPKTNQTRCLFKSLKKPTESGLSCIEKIRQQLKKVS